MIALLYFGTLVLSYKGTNTLWYFGTLWFQHALKGQKLLAQGSALGNVGSQQVAL